MSTEVWLPNIDETMTGNAWRFEGTLDVDYELCPHENSKALEITVLEEKIAQSKALGTNPPKKLTYAERMEALTPLAMQPLDPDFHKKVKRGDFLIGGDSTGYGHDHEHACIALRGAGVAAVICEGTNVNFRRNCTHHGLPVVVIAGIMKSVQTGDRLEVNIVEGWVKKSASEQVFRFAPPPDFMLAIMREGGLYPWMRRKPTGGQNPLAP